MRDTTDTSQKKSKTRPRPFDPIALAETTGKAVCDGLKKKYYGFGTNPDYQTGVATAYTVGCNLRCVFCWAHGTRDDPDSARDFYAPEEVFERLAEIARKRGLNQLRVSDAEPTIGKDHMLTIVELTERSDIGRFVLETNGILLGHDRDYVKALAQFKKLYVRVSIKAGTPEDFTRKTGAIPEAFGLPFQALRHLMEHGIDFGVAAMSADPRFMSPTERISLIAKLAEIDPELVLRLEEEMTILFKGTRKRLKASGWDFSRPNMPALLRTIPALQRFVQYSYEPVRSLECQKFSVRFTLKAIRDLLHGI